jgi:dihydropteroate synthase
MAFSFRELAGTDLISVMGIINLSQDSFYSKSRSSGTWDVLRTAEKMVHEGAHILDIGAESTRPGSKGISVELELKRLLPVIKKLTKEFNIPISVDTYKPDVASVVLQEGAKVINDISALRAGNKMAKLIAQYNAGIILMHMKGTPEKMQRNPCYGDVCFEVIEFLFERVAIAENAGIEPNSIAIDPGIGFGKTLAHNIDLIANLDQFKTLDKQILLGVSRKSFIGAVLNLEPDERLEGSIAAGIVGILNGANILRVHDVGPTVKAVQITQELMKAK